MISAVDLIEYAKRGYLVGPDESEEDFLSRINNFPSLRAEQKIEPCFGLIPNWIEVHYSNKGLFFWQGGCVSSDGKSFALQLRREFEHKKHFLFYSQKELLSHECIHAMRMAFDEPRFEESFAYASSSSAFRRACGPFFRTYRESLLGPIALFCCLLMAPIFPWVYLPLSVVLGYGSIRLWKTQRLFHRSQKKLSEWVGDFSDDVLGLMLLMTDKEIARCAKEGPAFILEEKKTLRHLQFSAMAFSLKSTFNP